MSITIRVKYKPKIKFKLGYGAFFNIRKDIAYKLSKRIGLIYEDFANPNFAKRNASGLEWETVYNNSDDKTKKVMEFLITSDCEGYTPPETCKILTEFKDSMISDEKIKYFRENILTPFFNTVEAGVKKGIWWT